MTSKVLVQMPAVPPFSQVNNVSIIWTICVYSHQSIFGTYLTFFYKYGNARGEN